MAKQNFHKIISVTLLTLAIMCICSCGMYSLTQGVACGRSSITTNSIKCTLSGVPIPSESTSETRWYLELKATAKNGKETHKMFPVTKNTYDTILDGETYIIPTGGEK